MTFSAGVVQGRFPVAVWTVDLRAAVQKQTNNGKMPTRRRVDKWRKGTSPPRVHVCIWNHSRVYVGAGVDEKSGMF